MKKRLAAAFLFLALTTQYIMAQETGSGIGIYPTGTETGFGYRSGKETRWALDVRITRANLFTDSKKGSFVNELSALYRIVRYEKVRFHVGMGGRADWNFEAGQSHRFGIVTPLGVEAFPFPFQNAGLFFEAAPFFTTGQTNNHNVGVRTVAGFVFYFIKKKSSEKI